MSEPQASWPDLAGRIEGARHILPVRVYFEDTDFSGLVYHASYVRFCERGRSDFVRLMGIQHSELGATGGEREPAAFVVRSISLDFLKPARIDDILEVRTECTGIGAATLTLDQEIWRGGTRLVTADVKVVLISRSGKPLRLGEKVRAALQRFKVPH
jgi:acyl-CoA thioester hydrolase